MTLNITACRILTALINIQGDKVAKINENGKWEDEVYQIQRGDKVSGGRNGIANIQATQLANRTQHLKQLVEGISVGETPFENAAIAQKKINSGDIPLNARFPVRDDSSDAWLAEYQNINGIATPTGKTLASGEKLNKLYEMVELSDSEPFQLLISCLMVHISEGRGL